ncbi:cold-regulated protein 27-like [Zingiber officinale]|uniref:cold-regulated protein 27-like n=1 Tax=Zingiber officinale TaxID=94328 RepID=UPI001C4D0348|nr:cold-regulated protein 27-like [Zingiber officinale]
MDDEEIPTEVSDERQEGSGEATGGSDDSVKSDYQALFLPTKWTDEKHNLYLNSMESSFLNQLYNNENGSSDLLDFLPPKPMKKLGSTSNFCQFSCQFDFLGTSSHNFVRKRTQFEMKNELINRAMPSLNANTNQKQADSSHMPRQHYAGNIAEVSDQNFDIDSEEPSEEQAAKRTKSHAVEPHVKDSST